jgi:hypothetical protein
VNPIETGKGADEGSGEGRSEINTGKEEVAVGVSGGDRREWAILSQQSTTMFTGSTNRQESGESNAHPVYNERRWSRLHSIQ